LRIGDRDVFGREVNAARKLGEDTAEANEILVTEAVRDAAGEIPGVSFEETDITVPGSAKNYHVRYSF
jgi:class 3 adenylate cyclase